MPPLTKKQLLEKMDTIWEITNRNLEEARLKELKKFTEQYIEYIRQKREKKEREKQMTNEEIENRK